MNSPKKWYTSDRTEGFRAQPNRCEPPDDAGDFWTGFLFIVGALATLGLLFCWIVWAAR